MLMTAIATLLIKFASNLLFSYQDFKVTSSFRSDLYKNILNKHFEWYNLPENETNRLMQILTSDV